jgi:uncharacterized damage-inducible protein DinB
VEFVEVKMNIAELKSFFAYNEWASARLLDAVAHLSEEQFMRNLSSSFPSIRDTFSHIVAVEWVWLRRWKGESPPALPEWATAPSPQVLRQKLSEVEAERSAFLVSLADQDVQQTITYRNLKGEEWRYLLAHLLLHLVNHSTYHRGQIATMLRQVGATPPPTDLLIFKDVP